MSFRFGVIGAGGAAARDRRRPQVDGVEATKLLRAIDKLYASSDSGTRVDLPQGVAESSA